MVFFFIKLKVGWYKRLMVTVQFDNSINIRSSPETEPIVASRGLKYRLCGCRCRCKINDLVKEKTGISIPLYLIWPSGSSDSFCSLDSYSAPASARSFPPLLCSDFRFPEISGCFGPSSASGIASDVHPLLGCNLIVEY